MTTLLRCSTVALLVLAALGCGRQPTPETDEGTVADAGKDAGKALDGGGTDGGTDAGNDAGTDACTADGGALQRPSVSAANIANAAKDVARDTSIAVDLVLPNACSGVDAASVNPETVKLTRVSDGVRVPGDANSTGGGDAIVFQPSVFLQPGTEYRFDLTEGVQDAQGQSFLPYSVSFTTGTVLATPLDPCIQFEPPVVLFDGRVAPYVANFTVTFGPDGRLYAAGLDGLLRRWDVDAETGALSHLVTYEGFAGRSVVGLVFDPRPGHEHTLWVSHNAPVYVQPAPDFSGTVSRLIVDVDDSTAFNATAEEYLVHLPRSTKDHLSNSVAFGPDQHLYLSQGSMSAMGAPDPTWGNRPEHALSAAILRIDPNRTTLPIDVQTSLPDGGPLPGSYDPKAAAAPVTVYGDGVRNGYDLVWHSNGHLYVGANGSAAGGRTPASPADFPTSVPALLNAPTQDDWLFDIVPGVYYGHPNPTRGHYVLNGGNPSAAEDFAEVISVGANAGYPVGVMTDPAYDRNRVAWNFGRNRSPNGSIEYRSTAAFGGKLTHALLVLEYSGGDDLLALKFDAEGKVAPGTVTRIAAGMTNPLDVVEHPTSGALFVTDLNQEGRKGGRLLMLKPRPLPAECAP